MSKIGRYIYGIMNSDKEEDFGTFGITACEEVYAVPYRGISAVVSNSEIVDYTRMFKDVLARLLVRHQKVIEIVMNLGYTIIPLRLGTFAMDEAEVEDILYKGYNLINEIFVKINDKIEIDVVATWNDFSRVLKETGDEEEIKEFKEKALANPKGVSADVQMRVGVMVKNCLDRKREGYALQIKTALSKVSKDIKGHELMDDKMVSNFAVLIDRHKQKEFDKVVDELNNRFAEKLNFRCVGPLPPYSFYTLEVKRIEFEEVERARKRLGLTEFSSKDEIEKNYRRMAMASHPDQNPDTPDIEGRFNELIRAYNIIIDYYKACEQTSQKREYSFNKAEFKKNATLVKVRD